MQGLLTGSEGADLFLHQRKLLQIAFQKRHLLLLGLAIAVTNHVVVLFFQLIELDLKLHDLNWKSIRLTSGAIMIITNLLASVLEITNKPFLQALKLGDLQGQALARPLEILCALGQILSTFNTSRCGSKGTLKCRYVIGWG